MFKRIHVLQDVLKQRVSVPCSWEILYMTTLWRLAKRAGIPKALKRPAAKQWVQFYLIQNFPNPSAAPPTLTEADLRQPRDLQQFQAQAFTSQPSMLLRPVISLLVECFSPFILSPSFRFHLFRYSSSSPLRSLPCSAGLITVLSSVLLKYI